MKGFLLTTTSLQCTTNNSEDLLFLGEWCKDYSSLTELENKNYTTIPYHWQDKAKFSRDYKYLDILCEELLVALSYTFNKYHNTNQPLEYWRIIISPWLLMFIPAIWDRWESLRVAFSEYKIKEVCICNPSKYDRSRYDYADSASTIQTQEMNYLIFSEIISFQYFNECKTRIIDIELNGRDFYIKSKSKNKRRLVDLVDSFFSFFQRKYKVIFFKSYLSMWSLIKISIKLKQVPRNFFEFNEVNFYKNGHVKSRDLNIPFIFNNDFERFLVSNISQHIPYTYLEGFSYLRDKVLEVDFYADIVFTANAHVWSEPFKIWCAEQVVTKKSKLIVSSHGGSIPPRKISFLPKYGEKISHKAVVWHKPIKDTQVRISANKFVSLKKIKMKKTDNVTLIGLDTGMFSFGMYDGPHSSLMLNDFSHKVDFIKSIPCHIFDHIKVLPYPNSPWNFSKRLIDIFGGRIISNIKDFDSVIASSKIIVCTYPQTTFSSAMISGTPTILLYDKRYWELSPEFDDLISILEKAKILFTNYELAANHVSSVFDNVDKWWESKLTIEARNKFLSDCVHIDEDWVSEWSLFFNKLSTPQKA
jgi:putative transferase (TIGR04331 family)